MTGEPPTIELDCRGLRCPAPVLRLARAIRDLPPGAEVTVLADDPAAGPDIRAWCRMRGHAFVAEARTAQGTPGYTVRRVR